MTLYNRLFMLLGLFLAFNLNAFCQEEDEEQDVNEKIAEQLRQKFDEVENFNDVFLVKQNGVWEFADAEGNILTNMRIENVENSYYAADLIIKGKKYTVYNGFEEGKLFVDRYGRFAYMDKNGNLTTPFIYDSEGEKTTEDANEMAALITTSDRVLAVSEEVNQGNYKSVKLLVKDISPELAGKFNGEVSDSLLVLMCKTYDNSPKAIDMKKAEQLFEGAFEPCTLIGCDAVLDYYEKGGLDKDQRLKYIQRLANEYNNPHARVILGDFMAEGKVYPKDVQKAIDYYKLAITTGESDYSTTAKEKLGELWKQYGNQYDNKLGELCAEYEQVEFNEDIIILTNGTQKMVVDTLYQELLPKGNYDIQGYHEDYFVIGDELSGWQLVKKGGVPVLNGRYEYITMINDGEEFQVVASSDERYGIYDKEGKPITQMIFDDYTPGFWGNPSLEIDGTTYIIYSLFKDGIMVTSKDDKYGCINTKGKEVIPFIYDDLTLAPNGKIIVQTEEKYGVIDKDGNELLPCKYDSIEYDEEEGKFRLTTTELIEL